MFNKYGANIFNETNDFTRNYITVCQYVKQESLWNVVFNLSFVIVAIRNSNNPMIH